jgi:polar amino acid transport system substrate-binding protein
MRGIHRIFLLGTMLAVAAGSCGAGTGALRILTTDISPLAFIKDGKLQGFCIDIVEHIQRRLGSVDAISLLPWARAYQMALTEENILLVCPKRTAERELKFHWVGPVLTSMTGLYVKTGTHPRLATLDGAREISSILVLRASYSYQDLSARGFHNLYEVNNADGMLRMLMAERAPAMMLERQAMEVALQEAGVERQAVTAIFELPSPTSNLAFSRDVPASTVRQWQAAFDAMKKDGSYARLVDKWFPPAAPMRRR